VKPPRSCPGTAYFSATGRPVLPRSFGLGADRCHAHDEAVADGAVVPLLYEGRLVEQQIAGKVIDTWLSGVSTYGTKLAI